MILHSVTTQLQFLFIAVAGWMSRHQQAVIEYLQEENRILLEQLGGKPKRFTDAQRIRLARKAKLVGRRRLGKLATLVTPDTLRWFRVLVAKKWTFPRPNPLGRPPVDAALEKLVVKLLQENPTWGSKRIVGALDNLGFKLSDSTVDSIRFRKGLDPAPLRGKSTSIPTSASIEDPASRELAAPILVQTSALRVGRARRVQPQPCLRPGPNPPPSLFPLHRRLEWAAWLRRT